MIAGIVNQSLSVVVNQDIPRVIRKIPMMLHREAARSRWICLGTPGLNFISVRLIIFGQS